MLRVYRQIRVHQSLSAPGVPILHIIGRLVCKSVPPLFSSEEPSDRTLSQLSTIRFRYVQRLRHLTEFLGSRSISTWLKVGGFFPQDNITGSRRSRTRRWRTLSEASRLRWIGLRLTFIGGEGMVLHCSWQIIPPIGIPGLDNGPIENAGPA